MPAGACDIFLLWWEAAETSNFRLVMDADLSERTYLAALMLRRCPALKHKLTGG